MFIWVTFSPLAPDGTKKMVRPLPEAPSLDVRATTNRTSATWASGTNSLEPFRT